MLRDCRAPHKPTLWGTRAARGAELLPAPRKRAQEGGPSNPHYLRTGRKVLPLLRRGWHMKRAPLAPSSAAFSHKGL